MLHEGEETFLAIMLLMDVSFMHDSNIDKLLGSCSDDESVFGNKSSCMSQRRCVNRKTEQTHTYISLFSTEEANNARKQHWHVRIFGRFIRKHNDEQLEEDNSHQIMPFIGKILKRATYIRLLLFG